MKLNFLNEKAFSLVEKNQSNNPISRNDLFSLENFIDEMDKYLEGTPYAGRLKKNRDKLLSPALPNIQERRINLLKLQMEWQKTPSDNVLRPHIAQTLAENANDCTERFDNAIKGILDNFAAKKNFKLTNALYILRKNLVVRLAYKHGQTDTHALNSFFLLAEGYGIEGNPKDRYSGGVNSHRVKTLLASCFADYYHPLTILLFIEEHMKAHFIECYGYKGTLGADSSYDYGELSGWLNAINIFFDNKALTLLQFTEDILLSVETEEADRLVDINWAGLRQYIWTQLKPLFEMDDHLFQTVEGLLNPTENAKELDIVALANGNFLNETAFISLLKCCERAEHIQILSQNYLKSRGVNEKTFILSLLNNPDISSDDLEMVIKKLGVGFLRELLQEKCEQKENLIWKYTKPKFRSKVIKILLESIKNGLPEEMKPVLIKIFAYANSGLLDVIVESGYVGLLNVALHKYQEKLKELYPRLWSIAIQHNKLSIVGAFIKAGADVDALCNNQGNTPLHLALSHGRLAIVNVLIEAGASVVSTDKKGRGPLFFACSMGDVETVKMLISKGADADLEPKSKTALLNLAMEKEHFKLAEYLIKELKFEIDETTRVYATQLLLKCAQGDKDNSYVPCALMAGADVNVADDKGETALMFAVDIENIELTQILLREGAEVNKADNQGETALRYSLWAKSSELTQILLRAGAEVNKADNQGKTALMYSVQKRSCELTKVLLAAGAEVNAMDKEGISALEYATGNGYIDNRELIQTLLDAGAEVTISKEIAMGVFENVISMGDLESTKILLNASINSKNKNLELIFMALVRALNSHYVQSDKNFHDHELINIVLEAGSVNVNAVDEDSETLLMRAVSMENVELTKVLLKAGADVHAVNKKGKTVLMHVIDFNDAKTELAQVLLEAGADISVVDHEGMTIGMYAKKYKDHNLISILSQAKAQQDEKGKGEEGDATEGEKKRKEPADGSHRQVSPEKRFRMPADSPLHSPARENGESSSHVVDTESDVEDKVSPPPSPR